jgi:4-hydroxybenzoate polyprenyltransferase
MHLDENRPLVVDLDGTLIYSDILYESILNLLRKNFFYIFLLPFWFLSGKAYFKNKIVEAGVEINPATLPYNKELIEWLSLQKAEKRTLILCTGTNILLAKIISNHLGLFEHTIASDNRLNLTGKDKAALLVKQFGNKQFDYVGNSSVDIAVWAAAKEAIVVNASDRVLKQAQKNASVERFFPKRKKELKDWVKLLRLHQWIKNILLFVPMFAAHLPISADLITQLFLAFLSFGFCASSVYIINDLLDLENDRNHPNKKFRPFASGAIQIWQGLIFIPVLFIASIVFAILTKGNFLIYILIYFVLTFIYSLFLKRVVLIDCLTLALLYTIRIIAGAQAINIQLSFWLLSFSMFFFLSLAFIKRYAELLLLQEQNSEKIKGRGYLISDISMIQQFGVSSGYLSVLVLALYLNSDTVVKLYKSPQIIFAALPIIMFWLSKMWLQTHRGNMHDDPIIFAVKDRTSLFVGFLLILVFVLAAFW